MILHSSIYTKDSKLSSKFTVLPPIPLKLKFDEMLCFKANALAMRLPLSHVTKTSVLPGPIGLNGRNAQSRVEEGHVGAQETVSRDLGTGARAKMRKDIH